MPPTIHDLLSLYNPDAPLDHAYTIPAPWYRDPRIESLEHQSVFAGTWQAIGRLDQVQRPRPVLHRRHRRRTHRRRPRRRQPTPRLLQRLPPPRRRRRPRIPRLRQTISLPLSRLDLRHRRRPQRHGRVRRRLQFRSRRQRPRPRPRRHLGKFRLRQSRRQSHAARRNSSAPSPNSSPRSSSQKSSTTSTAASTRSNCNWKVYVDNYLDGGYHVPHAHKGLSSVIEYTKYTIENFERSCLQSSPLSSDAKHQRRSRRHPPGPRLLSLDLSEFHDQRLRRRDGHQPRPPARPR